MLAYLEERPAYEEHCRRMLERFVRTTSRTTADRTLKAFLLVPRSAEECRIGMPLADLAVNGEVTEHLPFFEMVKGLAEYRAGNLENAVTWLKKSLEHHQQDGDRATVESLLAMCSHKSGK